MDGETIQAAKSLLKDSFKRVAADEKLDPVRNRRVDPSKGYRVGRAALMNAVAQEGPEVLSPAGDGYWNDMAKRYPWLGNKMDSGRRGHRATSIFRDGKWWKRADNGTWVEDRSGGKLFGRKSKCKI